MLCLSIVQVLYNLAGVVLELLRLVFDSKFPCPRYSQSNLALPHDVLQHRFVLELFLREDVSHCGALLLRTFLGFDLRLVRLVSVFRSSPGPSGQFQRTNLNVRFDSLDFVSA